MPDQPNIIFIFPDQWRGDSMSCLGHPVAETPFIDQLAAEGTTFTSAYTNCPVCIPARACLVTGQTPNTAGRFGYRDGYPWPYPDTFMRLLRDGGYQTMLSGKTHFHPPRARLGFEEMALYDNQRPNPDFKSDYDRWLERMTNGMICDTAQDLHSNSQLVHPWTHDEALHANSWTVTAAIDMLERRDPTRPFFLQVNFHRPHPPYDPPIEYFRRFDDAELPELPEGDWLGSRFNHDEQRIDQIFGRMDKRLSDRARRAYYAQLNHLDFQIGRLLRWLQIRRMDHDVLVVFSSDHGEMLGDHRLYRKSCAFEGSAHVPLIIRPPKSWDVSRHQTTDKPVALHDIAPTLLEAGKVEIPSLMEGKSLLSLLGQNAPDTWRESVHLEQNHGPLGAWQCLTDGHSKYIWHTQSGEELLFDLDHDPQECHNLTDDPQYADILASYQDQLAVILGAREEDDFVENGKLKPGYVSPVARPWIIEGNHAHS